MDVLPLYIVLLLWFAPMLWPLLRAPSFALIASATVYALTWWFDWNIPAYPKGVWLFNPFAWQLLFVFGAWCALGGAQRLSRWLNSPVIFGLAVFYLAFAFFIAMTWYFPRLAVFVPKFVSDVIYPIDKTNLDVLRIVHFLSLAVITVWFVPRDWPALRSRFFWPAIVCGQHSLETFCLGVFLSFAGHFVFTEVSNRLLTQIIVSLAGIAIMVGAAALVSWYKRIERQGPGPRPPTTSRATRGATHDGAWPFLLALLMLAGPAWAEHPAECRVAEHMIERDFPLPHVTRALAAKRLDVLVVGAGSSLLPGPKGAENAYPARLQSALAGSCRASPSR